MRLHAGAREHGQIHANLFRVALMHAPARAGIFAFGVLAHDNPVEVADAAQRPFDAGQEPGRAHIGVLVERLADREPQAPQRDVIGHARITRRAEIDRIEGLEGVERILGHHAPVLKVIVGAPRERLDLQRKAAIARRRSLQNLQPGRDHFAADPVTRYRRDLVAFHWLSPPHWWRLGIRIR